MTEINQKILDMVKQKKSIEEISNAVNLSYKQIYNRVSSLEDHGYIAKRIYNSNGNLTYTLNNDNCYHLNDSFELFNTNKKLKMIVISDLHIGNIDSDEEALDTIYNYCIKNGIHIIINCGDILDGTFTASRCFLPAEEQVEYLIKNYPFDKSIFTLYTLGDHDTSLYTEKRISLISAIKRRRHDICSLSPYSRPLQDDIIIFNNNKIMVSHKSITPEENDLVNIKLHLVGHNHTSKTFFEMNETKSITPKIMVPPLARNSIEGETNIPRAIELIIYMDNKYHFRYVEKRDLLILNNKAINTGETIINYSQENIALSNLEKIKKDKNANTTYVDDKQNTPSKTFKDSEEKEIGELSDEQKQKLNDFFGGGSSKKLGNMLKGAQRGKQKWQ